MIYISNYKSPMGTLLLASKDNKLIGVWIENQKYYLSNIKEELIENNEIDILKRTKKWLDKYFAGKKPDIGELDIAPIGTEFRKKVWKILINIPYGETTTYKEIARKLINGKESNRYYQAVGSAIAHNPIMIIMPCHRVVGANKSLTGYAGGLKNKIKLLQLEGCDITKFSIPLEGEDND